MSLPYSMGRRLREPWQRKDIVLMRFSMMAKYIVRYVGLFLLALFAVVALIALPVIAELNNHAGYDTSEKIYVNYEGADTPDNFCDILVAPYFA